MTGRFSVCLPQRGAIPSTIIEDRKERAARETSAIGSRRAPSAQVKEPSRRQSVSKPSSPAKQREGKTRAGREYQLGEFTHEHGRDAKHDHLVFTLSSGATVTYNDARRFGYMTLVPAGELAGNAFFAGLGVEPLSDELTPAYLARRALGKKLDMKALLMDQRIVAGLGNIYVCEALFRAGLSPMKPASRLAMKSGKPTPAADRLVPAIKAVLLDAIRAGGSTLRDYKQADGKIGSFQHEFAVYGREGEPCAKPGCRGTVRRKVQGGRSTFYCPACQR
jgi:formamidopyrimidine-DNA glycosylase